MSKSTSIFQVVKPGAVLLKWIVRLAPVWAGAVEPAMAQLPASQVVERAFPDVAGAWSELYSIAQIGPLLNPTGYVCVGRRDIGGGSYALHIIRLDQAGAPIPGFETLLVPATGPMEIAGASVEVMANGDYLVAGEFTNAANPNANVFVSRINPITLTPIWTRSLPGTSVPDLLFPARPLVTAREISLGRIIVVHHDLSPGPAVARATLLTAGGNWLWGKSYPVSGSSFILADVRENPVNANELWAAGSIYGTAAIFAFDVLTGAPTSGVTLYHAQQPQSWFNALTFDRHPNGSYSLVAAGAQWGGDFIQPPQPRIMDLDASFGGPNWDVSYPVSMDPAPTALSVNRGSGLLQNASITIAGGPWFGSVGSMLQIVTNGLGSADVWTYDAGGPYATINDLTPIGTMIGARSTNQVIVDPYLVYQRSTKCALGVRVLDLGPGGLPDRVLPECVVTDLIEDVPLVAFKTVSADDIICAEEYIIGKDAHYYK